MEFPEVPADNLIMPGCTRHGKGKGMRPPKPMATPAEVSAYLQVAIHTLANWRSQGKGPAWSKVGGRARYEWTDVRAYRESRRRAGTAA